MSDQNFHVIRIISSVPLEDQKAQAIAARFAERVGISDFEMRLETDPALIGGMIIFAGGFRYDYSIRGQLARIAGRLRSHKSILPEADKDQEEINALIRDNLGDALAEFSECPLAPGGEDIFLTGDVGPIDADQSSAQLVMDRLRETLESFASESTVDEIGHVISYSDGVATVRGFTELPQQRADHVYRPGLWHCHEPGRRPCRHRHAAAGRYDSSGHDLQANRYDSPCACR